jgi:hypothetical protein
MKTLDEHNADIAERERAFREMASDGAGVACPKCGTEMKERWPGTVNTSDPPTHWVDCPKCGYAGLMR